MTNIPPQPQYSPIELAVIHALDTTSIALRGQNAKDKVWTRRIKEELDQAGQTLRPTPYITCTNFLYDVTWMTLNQSNRITDIGMVLECEWGMDRKGMFRVMYDFDKLLFARADTRVMVFQAHSAVCAQTLTEMQSLIRGFSKTKPGDRYLFACWNRTPAPNNRAFDYQLFVAP